MYSPISDSSMGAFSGAATSPDRLLESSSTICALLTPPGRRTFFSLASSRSCTTVMRLNDLADSTWFQLLPKGDMNVACAMNVLRR